MQNIRETECVFTADIRTNSELVRAIFAENSDLTERTVISADKTEHILLFIDGLADKERKSAVASGADVAIDVITRQLETEAELEKNLPATGASN